MATFILMGTYSQDAIERISKDRTLKAKGIIEANGGIMKSVYVLLGEFDIQIITEFPDMKSAMKASIALTKETDISFSTYEAVTAEEFDQIMS
ncbi:GYD domain-containing protein [Bacteroidota bacterium]